MTQPALACKENGCDQERLARGWCSRHYQAWYRTNDTCSVEGCDAGTRARGWCGKHYYRWRKHGSTELPPEPTFEERFWARTTRTEDGCLVMGDDLTTYTAAMWKDGTGTTAHRIAYMLTRGDIPDGQVIDHLCDNPPCVEPSHLAATSQRVNTLRTPTTLAGRNARKSHCKRGHPLSGDNLYRRNGRRHCRACRAMREEVRA